MIRGPMRLRLATEWNDFLSPYLQSRLWLRGMDPYSSENFLKFWPGDKPPFNFIIKDAAEGSLVSKRGVPSPYPPTAFVVLAPLALASWKTAQFLWITLSLAAIGFIIWSLVEIAGASWRDRKSWVFAAFTLALAPFHSGLATGNPVVLVVALCSASIWAERKSRIFLCATLLALAVCLKPQIGMCFLLFFIVQQCWNVAVIAGSISLVLSSLAVVRLAVTGAPWFSSYLQTTRQIFQSGAINDFTPLNPVWFHMLNLQVVLYPLLGGIRLANFVAVLFGAALGGLWLWKHVKSGPHEACLLSLSALLVISLMPVYHRTYDAALVVFPLAWLMLDQQGPKRFARPGLALIAIFLSPGGVFVHQLAMRAHLPAEVLNSVSWRVFVVSHQTWALFFLAVFLLRSMFRASLRETQLEETAPELVLQS